MDEVKGNILGQTLVLADMVGYQEGAIVSRTLVDKKIGTISVFAFAEGEGLSEHTAPFDAFVSLVEGAAEVSIDGALHLVHAGQFIIIPANRPHSLRGVQSFKMLLVMIRS